MWTCEGNRVRHEVIAIDKKLSVEEGQTCEFDGFEDTFSLIGHYSFEEEDVVHEKKSPCAEKTESKCPIHGRLSLQVGARETSDEESSPSPEEQDEDAENDPMNGQVLTSLLLHKVFSLHDDR